MSRIVDLETFKEVFSPTRMLILFELAMGEKSLTELSKRLGLAPSTVHYHLKKLEKLGLVEVSRVEQRGNLLVKYYRASEDISVLGRALGAESLSEVIHVAAPCMVIMALKILEKLSKTRNRAGAMHIVIARLDEDKARQVINELSQLVERVKELEKSSRRGDHVLAIALTAVAHKAEE